MLESLINRFIYYPDPEWWATPDSLGLEAEEVHLTVEPGVELHAWFFPYPQPIKRGLAASETTGRPSRPLATLLFCHGNAGNVSHRLENVYYLLQSDFQVLLFDYRGFGHSSGQPSEEGLYRDAASAWSHMVKRPDAGEVPRIIFGRSLGGAVAVELATRVLADGLILESTFTSIRTLARLMFPPPLPELPVHYDSLSKISRIQMPLLAIHGQRDELIPYTDGRKLFDAAPEPKTWVPLASAGHNDTYWVGGAAYFQWLATFAAGLS